MKKIIYFLCIILFIAIVIFCCYDLLKKENITVYHDFAMGSDITLTLYEENKALSENVFNIIRDADNTISNSILGSEVSIINMTGNTTHSPTVANLIRIMKSVSSVSNNSLNPICGALTKLWDFNGETNVIPDENNIKEAINRCNISNLELENDNITLHNGALLDFGSIGKGYACECAVNCLGDVSGIISVGGSIGINGSKPNDSTWYVGVKDPNDPTTQVCSISIHKTCYISTSGSYEKYFKVDDTLYHHILNTENGFPYDTDIVSATVIADGGALSDAISTALFCCGTKGYNQLLETFDVSVIIIDKNNNMYISKNIIEDVKNIKDGYNVIEI